MDGTRFDDLVRELLTGASPRRLLLRLSALPLAGGLAALLAESESEAKKRKHKNKKKRKKKKRKKKATCSGGDVCAKGCPFSSVQAAINAASDGDTITLCAGTFTGNLTIDKDLTLVGAGEDATTLQGNGARSVVTIEAGTVRIENLRITGGASTTYGGGIHNMLDATLTLTGCTVTDNNTDNGYGNGIYNEGTLTVEDCTISENGLDAPGAPWGGALGNAGTLTVTNSALTGNRANRGGALYESSSVVTTLTGCDISDNVAVEDVEYEAEGGAIYAYSDDTSTLEVTDCTIRNNSGALNGGAVSLYSTAVFTDCAISGNSASEEGGGIYSDGTLTLDNTDVTENSAGDDGGGIFNTHGATVLCTGGSTVSGNTPGQCVDDDGGTGCNTCSP